MDFLAFTQGTPRQTSTSVTQPLSQSTSVLTANQMRNGGMLLLLLVIGCFCLRRWYHMECKQQLTKQYQHRQQVMEQHRQQIECLERIWRMEAYQKSEGDSR